MVLETSPTVKESPRNESPKEEIKEPKRSFREVMATRQVPHFPNRHTNIFDIAAKGNKKNKPQEQRKNLDPTCPGQVQEKHTPHEAQTELLSPLSEVKGLSLEMRALLDKMADYVQLESHNGVSTTTVSVEMKEGLSCFNGSEIRIEHYDTAPHAFNIQLTGNTEAVEIFAQHLASLQVALQQRLEHFHIQLLPPILSEKMQPFESYKKERKKHMHTEKPQKR